MHGPEVQQQRDGSSCGLFALALAETLAEGTDLTARNKELNGSVTTVLVLNNSLSHTHTIFLLCIYLHVFFLPAIYFITIRCENRL